MYISAAEFGLIIDALKYAAERVEESCGDIQPFGADDNEGALADAEAAKDLAKRLEENDEILGYDHVLLKETFNKETNEYVSCLDLINELFYDDYGKLRKYYCAIPTVDQWIAATEREHTVSLNMFPREEIERALDFLSDLWLDNEHAGWNRPDGTFNADRGKEAE